MENETERTVWDDMPDVMDPEDGAIILYWLGPRDEEEAESADDFGTLLAPSDDERDPYGF